MSDTDRILRLPDVITLTGLGRTSIYQGIKDGDFPKPVKLTKHAVGWRSSEITAWIASREPVGVSAGVSRESNAA
jgi:prophage regulatory protein